MAGIGFASVDTDVSSLVNAAFEELECVGASWITDCSGEQMGFEDAHGCITGMLCQEHCSWVVEELLPEIREKICHLGWVECGDCGQRFSNPDAVVKVYPL